MWSWDLFNTTETSPWEQQADLHLHTRNSDGQYQPESVVEKCIKKGLTVISLTDHDFPTPIDIFDKYKDHDKIQLIPGVEFSSYAIDPTSKTKFGTVCHILAYGIPPHSPQLQELCKTIQERRDTNNKRIIQILTNKYGYQGVTWEALLQEQGGINVELPDIARLMQNPMNAECEGYHNPYDLIGYGKPANNPSWREALESYYLSDVMIKKIHEMGGYAILAHPNTYQSPQERKVLDHLLTLPVDGIECSNFSMSEGSEQSKYWVQRCIDKDIMVSGGSDFHGCMVLAGHPVGAGHPYRSTVEKIKARTAENIKALERQEKFSIG